MERDEIHGSRAKVFRRISLRFGGADVPESFARAGVFTQSRATTAPPQVRACPGVNVGEEIFVGRALVMIKAQIHAAPIRDDVARSAMIHRDVMDEPRPIVEAGEEIILAGKAKTMVARVAIAIRLARRFINHALNRAETAVGENAAVSVRDAEIARPAVHNSGKCDGIVTHLGEMPRVRRVGKFKAKIFHARFRDGRLKAADLRMPLESDIKTQRTVKVDLIAIHLNNAANERRMRAALQISRVVGVAGIKFGGKRIVGVVRLKNFDALTDAEAIRGGKA